MVTLTMDCAEKDLPSVRGSAAPYATLAEDMTIESTYEARLDACWCPGFGPGFFLPVARKYDVGD